MTNAAPVAPLPRLQRIDFRQVASAPPKPKTLQLHTPSQQPEPQPSEHLKTLADQLLAEAFRAGRMTPVELTLTLRDPDNFMLPGPIGGVTGLPRLERLRLAVFADPSDLRDLLEGSAPAGCAILAALFAKVSVNRSGSLRIRKRVGERLRAFDLNWQVKGASTLLVLDISSPGPIANLDPAIELLDRIEMPVQRSIHSAIVAKTPGCGNGFRVLVIHQRTHEVAKTLVNLQSLGFEIGAFIGIPYGDASWPTVRLLDLASNHCYLALKEVTHPLRPATWEFDFAQSSFLDTAGESAMRSALLPERTRDYVSAMSALVESQLEALLAECVNTSTRLLIYEDGAYAAPAIHKIYGDARHRLHGMVRSAVDAGVIAGVVEVTVAGERADLEAMENSGQALLPVLSMARDDIQAIFEAKGAAEAILDSAAAALGNLGLPTFELRRIAVIGGNGAIGTRLVEKIAQGHNSVANVFSVDLSTSAFRGRVAEDLPHLAARAGYQDLGRYTVSEDSVPFILDLPSPETNTDRNFDLIRAAILRFLSAAAGQDARRQLVLTNADGLSGALWDRLWRDVSVKCGFEVQSRECVQAGTAITLSKAGLRRAIVFLRPRHVLMFSKVQRLIRSGIDTIVGVSGAPVLSVEDLDAFLFRRSPQEERDELVLISGSSKDHEFKNVIVFLDKLLAVLSGGLEKDPELGRWLSGMYRRGLNLFAPEDQASSGRTLRARISLRKEVVADAGTVYHFRIGQQWKRLVLLANGFAVNYFAKYKKGVKTEYLDPMVTLQMLGLVKLAGKEAIRPGLQRLSGQLTAEEMGAFWRATNERCKPLAFQA